MLSHLYYTAVTKEANICGGSVSKYKNGIIDFKSPREGQIFSELLIFGAGDMGQRVLNFLQGINIKPESFVVSDILQNPLAINGIAVKDIDEYISLREKCFVIIAAYPKWKKKYKKL